MYSKINKIASKMRECKEKYKECGRFRIRNYSHSLSDNGLKDRIHKQYLKLEEIENEIEKMKQVQHDFTITGDIEESLASQFAISKLTRKHAKEMEKLVKLRIEYRDLLRYNEKIREELEK